MNIQQGIDTLYEKLTKTPEGMRLYQQERVIQELTDMICEIMQKQGVTRYELAERLGKTERYVICLLDGDIDLPLRFISDVFTALNHKITFGKADLETANH